MPAHVTVLSGSTILADDTPRLTACTFSTNTKGPEALTYRVPLSLDDAFRRYDWPGVPQAILRADGAVPFVGRVEDVAIRGEGAEITALGYSRAMSDIPYTAFWSDDTLARWKVVNSTYNAATLANRADKLYTMDNNNRLFIGLLKNTTYQSGTNIGMMAYFAPNTLRPIVGVQMTLQILLPANWTVRILQWSAGFGAAAALVAVATTGILQTFAYNIAFAGNDIIAIDVFNATGAPVVFAGENGTNYVKATDVRIVTATTNRVDQLLTANRAAGVNVTATVASTARMFVGQRLVIESGGVNSETVTVLSIGSSTQFNATFVNNHVIGNTVQAFVIYADEIASDMLAAVAAINPSQVSTSTALLQSPGLDLTNEVYEDQLPSDIMDYLAGLGDNQTPPRQWEWGVGADQVLYFRPQSTNVQTWYVDISALELQRTIDLLLNSAYAVYQNANGQVQRTSTAVSAASITRYGLTRRQAVAASTTSSVQANVIRDAALADSQDPPPRFGITFDAVYNANGGRVPIWLPKAGDTAVIRNLPPTISVAIDALRTFRIARTECDLIAGTLTLEPETPLPRVAALLARLQAGVNAQSGVKNSVSQAPRTRIQT